MLAATMPMSGCPPGARERRSRASWAAAAAPDFAAHFEGVVDPEFSGTPAAARERGRTTYPLRPVSLPGTFRTFQYRDTADGLRGHLVELPMTELGDADCPRQPRLESRPLPCGLNRVSTKLRAECAWRFRPARTDPHAEAVNSTRDSPAGRLLTQVSSLFAGSGLAR
jgi:hypothetical protein